jgi:hypothetical protein
VEHIEVEQEYCATDEEELRARLAELNVTASPDTRRFEADPLQPRCIADHRALALHRELPPVSVWRSGLPRHATHCGGAAPTNGRAGSPEVSAIGNAKDYT